MRYEADVAGEETVVRASESGRFSARELYQFLFDSGAGVISVEGTTDSITAPLEGITIAMLKTGFGLLLRKLSVAEAEAKFRSNETVAAPGMQNVVIHLESGEPINVAMQAAHALQLIAAERYARYRLKGATEDIVIFAPHIVKLQISEATPSGLVPIENAVEFFESK